MLGSKNPGPGLSGTFEPDHTFADGFKLKAAPNSVDIINSTNAHSLDKQFLKAQKNIKLLLIKNEITSKNISGGIKRPIEIKQMGNSGINPLRSSLKYESRAHDNEIFAGKKIGGETRNYSHGVVKHISKEEGLRYNLPIIDNQVNRSSRIDEEDRKRRRKGDL